MIDSSLLALLEDALHRIRSSFVRYVVESSEAEVRDDFDRKAFALFEDWSRESKYSQMAVANLLTENGVVPPSSSFPIEFAQFNFLSAGYLLHPVLEKSAAERERLLEIRKALEGWARAVDLLGAVLSRHDYYRDRAVKLEEERPHEPARPARIKGTSASRW